MLLRLSCGAQGGTDYFVLRSVVCMCQWFVILYHYDEVPGWLMLIGRKQVGREARINDLQEFSLIRVNSWPSLIRPPVAEPRPFVLRAAWIWG